MTTFVEREPRFDPRSEEKVSIYQPEQSGLVFPGIAKFSSHVAHRQYLKERLVGACRAFAKQGFDYGFAGHLTVRDPERPHRTGPTPWRCISRRSRCQT